MTTARLASLGLAVLVVLWAGAARGQEGVPPPSAEASASVDELLAGLSSPDASARVSAVRALGERGDPVAVEPLIRTLQNDPVPEVRGWAVRALFQLGTPPARAAVVAAARQDPDERVRGMAARLTGVETGPAAGAAPSGPAPVGASPVGAAPAVVQPRIVAVVEPPPPPIRPPRPPGRGLRLGGWITTGITYGLAFLVGAGLMSTGADDSIDWGWKLMLPIVGPVVASMTNFEGDEAALSVWFWLWSAGQATGVILLAVGYAQAARAAREAEEQDEDVAERPRRHASSFRWALAPGGPGGPGLGLVGWW